jgi:hypothetical protein
MNYNIKYTEQGLCGYCGKNPPMDGIQRCHVCRQKNIDAQKKHKQKCIDEGICIYCKSKKAEGNLRGCLECNQKNNLRAKKLNKEQPEKVKEWRKKTGEKRKNFRIENGLCLQCGKKSEKTKCDDCLK